MKRDIGATEAAGFTDARSYVCWDSREVLYGADWLERKRQLWARCGGKCEYEMAEIGPREENGYTALRVTGRHIRCTQEAVDPHHVIRRSVQRDDRLTNLLAVCRRHHDTFEHRRVRFGEGRGESAESAK